MNVEEHLTLKPEDYSLRLAGRFGIQHRLYVRAKPAESGRLAPLVRARNRSAIEEIV